MAQLNLEKDEAFYHDALMILNGSGIPFMAGGTFAVMAYTGMNRPTKDIDFFVKAGDFPKILAIFSERGYKVVVVDERWLAKVKKDGAFLDFIFGSGNSIFPVTDEWLKESKTHPILDIETKLLPPTELIWSRIFIQERNKYEGSDIAHLILTQHKAINWKRLLSYLDQYWEVLLVQVLNFRFIYPSERERIPRWLLDELLSRLSSQINLPGSKVKICRGRLFSSEDYRIDVKEWGFADMMGNEDERRTKKSQNPSQ